MPIQPVSETLCSPQVGIFPDRFQFNVADPPPVEVAGPCMMMGMRVAPVVVWGKRQNAEKTANPVICGTLGEERAVTAIMLKDEEPKKEDGRRDRQKQGWPIAHVESD